MSRTPPPTRSHGDAADFGDAAGGADALRTPTNDGSGSLYVESEDGTAAIKGPGADGSPEGLLATGRGRRPPSAVSGLEFDDNQEPLVGGHGGAAADDGYLVVGFPAPAASSTPARAPAGDTTLARIASAGQAQPSAEITDEDFYKMIIGYAGSLYRIIYGDEVLKGKVPRSYYKMLYLAKYFGQRAKIKDVEFNQDLIVFDGYVNGLTIDDTVKEASFNEVGQVVNNPKFDPNKRGLVLLSSYLSFFANEVSLAFKGRLTETGLENAELKRNVADLKARLAGALGGAAEAVKGFDEELSAAQRQVKEIDLTLGEFREEKKSQDDKISELKQELERSRLSREPSSSGHDVSNVAAKLLEVMNKRGQGESTTLAKLTRQLLALKQQIETDKAALELANIKLVKAEEEAIKYQGIITQTYETVSQTLERISATYNEKLRLAGVDLSEKDDALDSLFGEFQKAKIESEKKSQQMLDEFERGGADAAEVYGAVQDDLQLKITELERELDQRRAELRKIADVLQKFLTDNSISISPELEAFFARFVAMEIDDSDLETSFVEVLNATIAQVLERSVIEDRDGGDQGLLDKIEELERQLEEKEAENLLALRRARTSISVANSLATHGDEEFNALKAELGRANTQIIQLRKNLGEREARLADSQAEIDARQLELTKLRGTLKQEEQKSTKEGRESAELQQNIDELKEELAALKADFEAKEREFESLTNERDSAAESIRELQGLLGAKGKENDELVIYLDELDRQLLESQRALLDLQQERGEVRGISRDSRPPSFINDASLLDETAGLDGAAALAVPRDASVQTKDEEPQAGAVAEASAQLRVRELAAQLAAANAQKDVDKDHIAGLEAELAAAKAENARLGSQTEAFKAENERLKAQLGELEERVVVFEKTMEDLIKEKDEVENNLAKSEAEKRDLQTRLDKALAQIEAHKGGVEGARVEDEATIRELRDLLAKATAEVDANREKLSRLASVEEQLAAANARLDAETAEHADAQAELRAQLDARDAAHADAQAELAEKDGQMAELQAQIAALNDVAAARGDTDAERDAHLAALAQQLATVDAAKDGLREALTAEQAALKKARLERDAEKATLALRDDELEVLRAENTGLNERLAGLNTELANVKDQLAASQEDVAQREREKDELAAELARAKENLDDAIKSGEANVSLITKENTRLEAELEASERNLDQARAEQLRVQEELNVALTRLTQFEELLPEIRVQLEVAERENEEAIAKVERVNAEHEARLVALREQLAAQDADHEARLAAQGAEYAARLDAETAAHADAQAALEARIAELEAEKGVLTAEQQAELDRLKEEKVKNDAEHAAALDALREQLAAQGAEHAAQLDAMGDDHEAAQAEKDRQIAAAQAENAALKGQMARVNDENAGLQARIDAALLSSQNTTDILGGGKRAPFVGPAVDDGEKEFLREEVARLAALLDQQRNIEVERERHKQEVAALQARIDELQEAARVRGLSDEERARLAAELAGVTGQLAQANARSNELTREGVFKDGRIRQLEDENKRLRDELAQLRVGAAEVEARRGGVELRYESDDESEFDLDEVLLPDDDGGWVELSPEPAPGPSAPPPVPAPAEPDGYRPLYPELPDDLVLDRVDGPAPAPAEPAGPPAAEPDGYRPLYPEVPDDLVLDRVDGPAPAPAEPAGPPAADYRRRPVPAPTPVPAGGGDGPPPAEIDGESLDNIVERAAANMFNRDRTENRRGISPENESDQIRGQTHAMLKSAIKFMRDANSRDVAGNCMAVIHLASIVFPGNANFKMIVNDFNASKAMRGKTGDELNLTGIAETAFTELKKKFGTNLISQLEEIQGKYKPSASPASPGVDVTRESRDRAAV